MTDTIVTTVLLLAAVTAWVVWIRMVVRDLRQIEEELRLANKIAYVAFLEMQYAEAAKHPEGFDWKTREASVKRHGIVLAEIREALGLS